MIFLDLDWQKITVLANWSIPLTRNFYHFREHQAIIGRQSLYMESRPRFIN